MNYTDAQLLLLLNYDTNEVTVLTLPERIKIHSVINSRSHLSDEFEGKVRKLLLQIAKENYKKQSKYWVENTQNSKLELIIKN